MLRKGREKVTQEGEKVTPGENMLRKGENMLRKGENMLRKNRQVTFSPKDCRAKIAKAPENMLRKHSL